MGNVMAPHTEDEQPSTPGSGTTALPKTWVPVNEDPLFVPKKMRVVTAGAGHAGLMIAYKMRHEIKVEDFVDHVIYEKNVRTQTPARQSLKANEGFSTTLVVLGWKTGTQVLLAMFQRTFIPTPGSQIRTGALSTVVVKKSSSTSKIRPKSMILLVTLFLTPR